MQLISQFITAFLSGIASAYKKGKAFTGAMNEQTAGLDQFFGMNQADQQQAETAILSGYEAQLKAEQRKNELAAVAFDIFLIIVALVIVYLITKKK